MATNDLSMKRDKRIWQIRSLNLLHGMASATIGFNVLFLQTAGMDPRTVGVVMGINALVGALSPPLWGYFADKIQSKYRIFLYTILGSCIASFLVPLSATVKILGVMLTTAMIPMLNFFRMPSQSVLDTATVTASKVVPGMEYSSVRWWMSLGFTAMSFAYSPLVDLFGVNMPFFGFVLFGVAMLMGSKTLIQYEVPQEGQPESPAGGMQLSRLFTNYYLMVFICINILIMIPLNAGMMIPYLLSEVNADTAMVGIITGVRVSAEIMALLLAPRIKRVLQKPMILVVAALLFICEMTSYQIANSFITVALSAMFGGAGFGLVLSTGYNYVNELSPKGLEATAISLYTMGLSAAGVLTSFLGGQIIALQGIRMLYVYCGACVILWLIIFVGSYFVGEKALKIKAPIPFFRRVADEQVNE